MKYQKKPVIVEAVHYNPNKLNVSNLYEDKRNWRSYFSETPEWLVDALDDETIYISGGKVKINTMEGDMTIEDGSYIIRGVQGEIYACDEVIFHETYEGVNK